MRKVISVLRALKGSHVQREQTVSVASKSRDSWGKATGREFFSLVQERIFSRVVHAQIWEAGRY